MERDHIETAMAILLVTMTDLDELVVRNSQALRRSELVRDLLEPALDRLTVVKASISQAKHELDCLWAEHRAG